MANEEDTIDWNEVLLYLANSHVTDARAGWAEAVRDNEQIRESAKVLSETLKALRRKVIRGFVSPAGWMKAFQLIDTMLVRKPIRVRPTDRITDLERASKEQEFFYMRENRRLYVDIERRNKQNAELREENARLKALIEKNQ